KYVAKMQATTEVELVLRVLGLEPELPSAMVDALFRLVQEGTANVLKHARANRFTVKLEFQPAHLYVVMEDDGVGFNVEERKEGYGLVGMRERVELLEGEFQLNSAPGQGTKIGVKVPIKTKRRLY